MDNNSQFRKLRRELLFELLDKYPDSGDMTIAKILYNKYPEFYKDVESARSIVRIYRGHCGEWKREHIINKKYYKNVQPS